MEMILAAQMSSSQAIASIVIVDDDDAARDSLQILLELQGFAVEAFETCEDFLRSAVLHTSGCLVLDVHLPGMSGLELMDELNSRQISLPTILVTGRNDKTIQERAVALGAVILLEKPIDFDALMAAIAGTPGA
ncbi:MAG TPA: response regulator [Terriglobales bacterium]|nr:response regulator [Terriglobales bacterium]